jgi:RNA polymerase sigma-70 factor (ECF subfamily)
MDRPRPGHAGEVVLAAVQAVLPRPPPAESSSFEALYDEYFDFVWRSARRLGVDDRSLDDAAQDVFIVVHRRLRDFEGRASIKSWLFGIARRVAHDHRRRARRKDRSSLPADGLADVTSPSPRDTVARVEAAQLLTAFLDTLDDDKRETFILAELEQMTVPEIAEAVDANVNTVYSRLRAARKAFEQTVSRIRARDEHHLAAAKGIR